MVDTPHLGIIGAMTMTDAVVGAGEIVEKDRGPELRREIAPAGRLDQPNGMHHHARDVRLAVQRARMPELLRQRHDPRKRQLNKGHGAEILPRKLPAGPGDAERQGTNGR